MSLSYMKIFIDIREELETLTDEECGRLFKYLLTYARTGEISNSAEEMSKEKQCDILLAAANMDCSVLTEDEEKKFMEYFIKVSEYSVKRFNLKPQAPKQGRKPLPYYNNQQGKGKKK